MSNQTEVDYEKQFQEDLAKATALSLEQEALDEYNRTKKYGPAYTQNAQQEAKNKYYAQIKREHYARTASTGTDNSSLSYGSPNTTPQHSLALPKLQTPQRRHSEANNHNASTSSLPSKVERSKTPPASSTLVAENDLINFASPTSKNPENNSFEKLIEDLQKMQTTNPQTALVPLGPTAAAPMYPPPPTSYHPAAVAPNMYAGSAAAVHAPAQYGVATPAGAIGMQLVPFVPSTQQQKIPLTNDELTKLYNMAPPHSAPVYGPRHAIGFVPPMGPAGYYPQTPPIMPGGQPPYTAPLHYPNAYGFQYQTNMTGVAAQQPHFPSNLPTSASSSNSSMAASAMNVNPLNRAVHQTSNNSFNQTHSSTTATTSNSASSMAAGSTSASSNGFNARRQTPPARKMSVRVPGSDLIDLSHDDE